MPEWFQTWLSGLSDAQKGELAQWIITTDDNEVTTEIVCEIDPGT